MKNNPHENDRSEYTDTGFRDPDPRRGFGDDQGTRIGRPDAEQRAGGQHDNSDSGQGARVAPKDTQGPPRPGQPSTNTDPVADGIEGSEPEEGQGAQQSHVQDASKGITPAPPAGDDRPTYNL